MAWPKRSSVRARIEHVFAVISRLWDVNNMRYRGLRKNVTRVFTALALALANRFAFFLNGSDCRKQDKLISIASKT